MQNVACTFDILHISLLFHDKFDGNCIAERVFYVPRYSRHCSSAFPVSLPRNHLILAARAEGKCNGEKARRRGSEKKSAAHVAVLESQGARASASRGVVSTQKSRGKMGRRRDEEGARKETREERSSRPTGTTQDAARARSTGWASTRRLRASSHRLGWARASSVGPGGRIAPRPHRSRTRERFLGGIRLPAGRPNVRYFSPFHRGPYNLLVSCRPRIMSLILLVFHSTLRTHRSLSLTLCFFSPSFSRNP